jgi:hypothetical protein
MLAEKGRTVAGLKKCRQFKAETARPARLSRYNQRANTANDGE